MRMIGSLESGPQAQHFADFLYAKGVDCQVEQGQNGNWQVWIVNEGDVATAQEFLDGFLRDPHDPKYAAASAAADERRREAESDRRRRMENFVDVRRRWTPLGGDRLGYLTGVLIAISIVVAIITGIGSKPQKVMPLQITDYEVYTVGERAYVRWDRTLPEVRKGEVWRLITPIFIHYGFLHILFNMWWLKDLGSMIERRQNTWMLLLVVVLSGVASNLGQFWVSGPRFGGMSGVVYALLGYAWIRGRFDPRSGLHVPPQIVQMMIVWFVLCILLTHSGLFPVANMAHGVGLAVGGAIGAVTSRGLWRRVFG